MDRRTELLGRSIRQGDAGRINRNIPYDRDRYACALRRVGHAGRGNRIRSCLSRSSVESSCVDGARC